MVNTSDDATSIRPKAMLAQGLLTKGFEYRSGPSTSQYESRLIANVTTSNIPLTSGLCASPKYSALSYRTRSNVSKST